MNHSEDKGFFKLKHRQYPKSRQNAFFWVFAHSRIRSSCSPFALLLPELSKFTNFCSASPKTVFSVLLHKICMSPIQNRLLPMPKDCKQLSMRSLGHALLGEPFPMLQRKMTVSAKPLTIYPGKTSSQSPG